MRETFKISRAMEFFSESELTTQMGLPKEWWPIAILKELIDNGLDACESARITPEIEIELTDNSFSVKDNGKGLPKKTFNDSFDFNVRVSDKQGYVSPSRGQQGNALKTIWAAPVVVSEKEGIIEVYTDTYAQKITIKLDAIANQPIVTKENLTPLQSPGTLIKIVSPELRELIEDDEALSLVYDFLVVNPHANFRILLNDEKYSFPAKVEGFKKWTPADPSSAYWYDSDSFNKLVAALITNGRESEKKLTIRDFVKQFEGLKRTEKQKLIGEAIAPVKFLEDLANDDGLSCELINKLLELLKSHSDPVKPERLGVIGKEIIRQNLIEILSEFEDYKKISGYSNDLPFVVEIALGRRENEQRIIYWNLNFTPLIGYLPQALLTCLASDKVLIDKDDPIALFIHISIPKMTFNDRGKSQINLPKEVLTAIQTGLESVAKHWAKAKRKQKREERASWKEIDRRRSNAEKKISVKEAAYSVMKQAYREVSDNGHLPANARQLMYFCRPLIIEITGETKPWKNDSYFTQNLLPAFIRENPELTANWDVIYDARGNFQEPHSGYSIPLGTLKVRHYLQDWRSPKFDFNPSHNLSVSYGVGTSGPQYRFKFALFIEKEGFLPLLNSANIANRYDIAIFSTKGMSTTASRQLVEQLARQDVTILVAHDFDKSGMTIARTLGNDTTRYQFSIKPEIIDIGLRLSDIEEMELTSEPVDYGKSDPIAELENCGCSEKEINFLARRRYSWEVFEGDRVELNAMTSPQFIEWLERKFEQHGVTKVIPDNDDLHEAYRLQFQRRQLETFYRETLSPLIKNEVSRIQGIEVIPPDNLRDAIAAEFEEDPCIPWELALMRIVQNSTLSQENLAC